ncbi:MAG: hypothetical protein FJ266_16135 [Planctomycetes bacterium]|nr:hypothetical protein [Planctomycetota bacterium]
MELTIDDKKMRDLMKEVIIEIMKENREGFCDLISEAIEEVGLANAIKEGRKNKFVKEDKILNLLEG